MFVLIYCVVIFQIVDLNLAQIYDDFPIVKTTNGFVRGRTATRLDYTNSFVAFRGIPYASPPIGDLRFRPPQAAKNWKGIRDAFTDGSPCVQGSLDPCNEDCLFINVYSPKLEPDGNLLPVLVWIHGGAFTSGDSSYSKYGPDYFMDAGIMFVSFNYRLGIFGFMSTGDLASPGNYGLKDQIMALRWIQDNIRAFGGNPNEVTIFGESAGAASVSYLVQSPLTRGLYQRAISNSGSALCQWALNRNASRITEAIAAALEIDTSNTTKMVDELRRVDSHKLLIAAHEAYITLAITYNRFLEYDVLNLLHGLPFSPTIEPEHDGAVLSGNSHELLENHKYNNVSYLMGFNSKEGGILESTNLRVEIIHNFYIKPLLLPWYDSDITRLIPANMNVRREAAAEVAYRIKQAYFGWYEDIASNVPKFENFISDDQFARPIRETVRLYSRDVPVYYYQFSYMGNLGSLDLFDGRRLKDGVAHGEDLGYLFRASGYHTTGSEKDEITRMRLVMLWTNFVKYGNPTPPNDYYLENINWPMARTPNSDDENLLYLDIGENLVVKSNPRHEYITFWHDLYRYYGQPPYDTY